MGHQSLRTTEVGAAALCPGQPGRQGVDPH